MLPPEWVRFLGNVGSALETCHDTELSVSAIILNYGHKIPLLITVLSMEIIKVSGDFIGPVKPSSSVLSFSLSNCGHHYSAEVMKPNR